MRNEYQLEPQVFTMQNFQSAQYTGGKMPALTEDTCLHNPPAPDYTEMAKKTQPSWKSDQDVPPSLQLKIYLTYFSFYTLYLKQIFLR